MCRVYLSEWYFEKDGQLYCKQDYWDKFGEACNNCSTTITGPIMVRRIYLLMLLGHCVDWCHPHFVLLWRNNGRDGVSNYQPYDCLLNRLFRRRSKKTSKLHVNGLCTGNSPVTGEFPAQRASNTESVSLWWHHHRLVQFVSHKWFIISLLKSCGNSLCFNRD